MTNLDKLRGMMADGSLHHVTYRCRGTVWEGLWFYRKAADGFRGYEVAGCVNKNDPDYADAEEATRGIGIHVGAYGHG